MVGTADSVLNREVCLIQSVLYREVPLYLWYLGESNTPDREPTPRYSTWYCPLSLSPAASCLNLIRSITYRALQREGGRRGWEGGERWRKKVGGRDERESCSNHTQVVNTQSTMEKWKNDADKTEEKRDESLKLTHAMTVT